VEDLASATAPMATTELVNQSLTALQGINTDLSAVQTSIELFPTAATLSTSLADLLGSIDTRLVDTVVNPLVAQLLLTKTELQGEHQAILTAIEGLPDPSSTLTLLQEDLAALQTTLTNDVVGPLTDVGADVDTLSGDIANLQNSVSGLQGGDPELSLSSVRDEISTAILDLQGDNELVDLSTLEGSIATLQQEILSLTELVTGSGGGGGNSGSGGDGDCGDGLGGNGSGGSGSGNGVYCSGKFHSVHYE